MKQFFFSSLLRHVCVVLVLINTISMWAANEPRWLKRLPNPENDTYFYRVVDAINESENVAYEKAHAKLIRSGMENLGVTLSMDDVNKAISTGHFTNLQGEVSKLPIRVVCSYTHRLKAGGVKVYLLGQVAEYSISFDSVKFTPFRNCDYTLSESGELVDQMPTNWMEYQTPDYEFKTAEMEVKQDRLSCQHTIETEVHQSLIEHAALKDTTLHQFIHVNTHIGKSVAYAIAYIKKGDILRTYMKSAKVELELCGNWLNNASNYLNEKKIGETRALAQNVQKNLKEIDLKLAYIEANVKDDFYYSEFRETYEELYLKQGELLMKTKEDDMEQRENKIKEYVNWAENLLSRNAVGDALRYLYAAQLLLVELPSSQEIKLTDPSLGEVQANVAITEKIKHILTGVKVVCDGTLSGNQREVKLSFIYNDAPIMGINFMYNSNEGWSDYIATTNGWATAYLPENNTSNNIHVMLDYRCVKEANFDVELPALYQKYQSRFDYDEAAKKIVAVQLSKVPTTEAALGSATTNLHENVVVKSVQKPTHRVNANDSIRYAQTVLKVCELIRANKTDWESLAPYFTARGHEQYMKLLKYGKIRIISTDGCRYLRIGQEVQCRSIPVSFSFSKGKLQYENIVFTLLDSKGGKIDGVQFALEERSLTNIMGETDIDEVARLALINFMENYKTAFAFQNWDYVESIFSDDAIIITGRVIRRQETMADGRQQIINEYKLTQQSKKSYINRLRSTQKEWINIKFGSTLVERSHQDDLYGLSMCQDYYSNNYGDHGYLFLMIDNTNPEQPLIRIRAWQPNEHFKMGKYQEVVDAYKSGTL